MHLDVHASKLTVPLLLFRHAIKLVTENAGSQRPEFQGITVDGVLPAGLGSSVSALHLLQRNPNAVLTGLSRPSSSSSSKSATAVLLWDLRKPKRAAASLGFSPADLPSDAGGSSSGGSGSCSGGAGGVCSLSVREDGVLAAAGCADGTVLVWDMRQVSINTAGHIVQAELRRFEACSCCGSAVCTVCTVASGSCCKQTCCALALIGQKRGGVAAAHVQQTQDLTSQSAATAHDEG